MGRRPVAEEDNTMNESRLSPRRALTLILVLSLSHFATWPLGHSVAFAQSSNGTYTLMQDVLSSGGGAIGSGNLMSAQTVVGLPAGGAASNGTFTLIGGIDGMSTTPDEPPAMTVTVTGLVDDSAAAVMVSANGNAGVTATVVGSQFTAQNLLLYAGPNTISATATDRVGNVSTNSMKVLVDLPPQAKTVSRTVDVQLDCSDPSATVTVNGTDATLVQGKFLAKAVALTEGYNRLLAKARDQAGNEAQRTIGIMVDTHPPARPTVGTLGNSLPDVTTASLTTLSGTKTRGTSIWINGTRAVPTNDETIWSANVALVEGDNDISIVAKDLAGNESAADRITIVVDNLPPIVTFQPPAKTNFNPVLLSGSVDDHLTTVTMNGLIASRNQRAFEVAVPLTLGPNALHLIAISPNRFTTQHDYTVTLGTIPTIQSAQPVDGTKLYLGKPAAIQVTAIDQENDPIRYRILLNRDEANPLFDWSPAALQTWSPGTSQLGLRTLTVGARDDYGGSNQRDQEVFVIRQPVDHP